MSGDYVKVFTKGLQSALESTSIENGKLRFTVDSGRLYLDHNTSRIAISGVVTGFTDSEIRNLSTPLPLSLKKLVIFKINFVIGLINHLSKNEAIKLPNPLFFFFIYLFLI